MKAGGKNYKNVAIVSDITLKYGGAERVVEAFFKIYPDADFYTLFIAPSARKEIENKFPKIKIHTSIFQGLINKDLVTKYISIIKLVSWIYWETLNLSKYDLVISSSHSYMSKNVKKGMGAKHLSYIHTPPRFLYKEFCEITLIRKVPFNVLLKPVFIYLRWIDKRGSKRPDVLVVNSNNVKKRVKDYYQREAKVIYPPVDVVTTKPTDQVDSDYYICLSRLVKQKGIRLAVETCTKYNLPLKVIGDGDEKERLKSLAGPSVVFLDSCDDKEKNTVLSKAKALIYTSIEEDFGIVPVEALKLGVPVVAYKSGGVEETIIDGVNGVLFDKFSISHLKKAMDRLNGISIKKETCIKTSEQYSFGEFKKQIMNLIRV